MTSLALASATAALTGSPFSHLSRAHAITLPAPPQEFTTKSNKIYVRALGLPRAFPPLPPLHALYGASAQRRSPEYRVALLVFAKLFSFKMCASLGMRRKRWWWLGVGGVMYVYL